VFDLVIKGGTVVTARGSMRADVGVRGGEIAALAADIAGDAPAIDARGRYVLPGAVDVHTHVRAATEDYPDRFFVDTVAAAVGGTTTFLAFAWQPRGGSLLETLRTWRAAVEKDAAVDHGTSLIVTDPSESALAEIPHAIGAGCPTFKAFMVYEYRVSDAALFDALETTRAHGGMMQVHCENCTVIDHLVARHLAEGKTAPRFHAQSRPPLAEAEATHRALALAKMADAPVYSVHLSCGDALRHVREAKAEGLPAFAETCPHYLTLSDDRYDASNDQAARYVISPPLRPASHQAALWTALARGDLDLVATDHVPDRIAIEKHRGEVPFDKIGNGAPGIETLLTLVYSEGVAKGRLTIERMVDVIATTPARLFGLTRKGAIEIGKDADLVIFDPDARRMITQRSLHHATDFTPYEGFEVRGAITHTILRGRVIVRDGAFVGARGAGAWQGRTLGWM
jgi:dihydropyrimidinase